MSLCRVLFACLLLLPAASPAAADHDRLRLLTEEYPPFSFSRDGVIAGAAVDQVSTLMARAGLDYDLEIMPWARAYALTLRAPRTCIFTTAHSRERDLQFAWVEPLVVSTMVAIGRRGSGLTPRKLDDLRGLKLGTQLADHAEGFLRERGFQDLDLAPDITLTLKKLETGRIDVAFTTVSALRSLTEQGHAIEPLLMLPAQIYGIACHRSTPPALIDAMQTALDSMIADGTQAAIARRYGLGFESLAPPRQKGE